MAVAIPYREMAGKLLAASRQKQWIRVRRLGDLRNDGRFFGRSLAEPVCSVCCQYGKRE